jgi:hypothetical protein
MAGDAEAAIKVMHHHLEAVVDCALIMPAARRNRELADILDSHVGEVPPSPVARRQER